MNTLATTGITININGAYETYYGGLFISLGDYPAQISLNGFKESVSATHFYHLCDIEHDHLEVDITHDFPSITVTQYRERCIGLELIQGYSKSYENLSKRFGINCRSLFDGLYDVTRQCPYDTIRTLLEHNDLFRQLYTGKMKYKFHFMTFFPAFMKDFESLAHTSCLATERKHQFFKGNKVRNLKHPSLMLMGRNELWLCINDHFQDESLSNVALSGAPYSRVDPHQSINDGQIQFLISNIFHLLFKP
ncbi:unnamed protein product [Rotaria magnacalcarata]|uniref:Uncharacterized protein n=1 Tax=Rotaria magnacalcarata TaxID=392030 RepID=A0A815Z6B2_9BILA|nr:unnamed protein product [Rotaria magnacalcarata]CAF1580752.1 unnamed protein product [Rotaria magnacalcarata]CAF4120075.1 unnamed protein product [Rotaria magnacalcarata]CAF4141161.1 unnamed protein product [Rotaria magnacalcarata]